MVKRKNNVEAFCTKFGGMLRSEQHASGTENCAPREGDVLSPGDGFALDKRVLYSVVLSEADVPEAGNRRLDATLRTVSTHSSKNTSRFSYR